MGFSGQAQGLFISGNQTVSLDSGALISTPGGVTNQGTIINRGTMSVAGNWINRQSYAGTGLVELTSSSEQIVQHNGQSMARLLIEGGGQKQLRAPLIITENLILNQGFIRSSSENFLRISEEGAVSNASSASYIVGPVQCAGTGYRFFPVGTESLYAPVELLDVQGVSLVLSVQVNSPNPEPLAGEGMESVSPDKYWQVDVIEGEFSGSVATLPVGSEDGFNELAGAVVAQATQLGGDFSSLGQSARQGTVQDGYVTSERPATLPILALGLTSDLALDNTVEVASAFAPEAINPENRRLKVYGANLDPANFTFTVFNRWGQVVYQTEVLAEAQDQGWDGTHFQTRQPLPVGVYHYVVRGIFESSQSVEKTGAVTLFR